MNVYFEFLTIPFYNILCIGVIIFTIILIYKVSIINLGRSISIIIPVMISMYMLSLSVSFYINGENNQFIESFKIIRMSLIPLGCSLISLANMGYLLFEVEENKKGRSRP